MGVQGVNCPLPVLSPAAEAFVHLSEEALLPHIAGFLMKYNIKLRISLIMNAVIEDVPF